MIGYENVWRTNYEAQATAGWLACFGWLGYLWYEAIVPSEPLAMLALVCLLSMTPKGWRAWKLWQLRINLAGRGITFIKYASLIELAARKEKAFWMGWGFHWTREHSQRLYDLMRADSGYAAPPLAFVRLCETIQGRRRGQADGIGKPWIHGLGLNEETDIHVPIDYFSGNTLIAGTTGCGKTRLLELIATMAIALGYTVLGVDPKGDQGFEKSLKKAARAAGRINHFVRFHLGFPRNSVRIDMLRNYSNLSDLASRVSALMGGSEENAPFRNYAFDVLNGIAIGMDYVGDKVSLVKLRSYVDNGVANLLLRVALKYFDENLPRDWESAVAQWAKTALNRSGRGRKGDEEDMIVRQSLPVLLKYYVDVLIPRGAWSEPIDSLAEIYGHDAKHHAAMITSLKPLLTMLTTGELGGLLSPDVRDIDDTRPVTDNQALIRSNSIVYIGLDSLANKTISSAVGSLYLSDLTSVAAGIYNYGTEGATPQKVFLIVDEASEVLNDPFVQLLNKSRGAGFVIFTATQTISDFSARFGSMDKALQMLGNFNNLIAMRVKDKATQEYVVENFGSMFIQTKETTYSNNTNSQASAAHVAGGVAEKIKDKAEDMLPQFLLGELCNWEYFASFSGGHKIKGRLPIIRHAEE